MNRWSDILMRLEHIRTLATEPATHSASLPKKAWRLSCILVLAVAATFGGCSRGGQSPPPSSEPSVEPPLPPPPPPKSVALEVAQEVARALAEIQDRQACNLVAGCPALDALATLGESAAAPTAKLIRATPKWSPIMPFLIEALGRLGSAAATELPLLRELAEDSLFAVRVPAIVALGRLGDLSRKDHLVKIAAGSMSATDLATRAAAAYALVRMGAPEYRHALARMFPPAAVEEHNWAYTALVIPLLEELDVEQAAPGVRRATLHGDYFLRRAAAKALARLGDESDVPLLLFLLGDDKAGVRRAAMSSLQAITHQHLPTEHAWLTWAKTQGISPLARADGEGAHAPAREHATEPEANQ